ncbi:MAG: hypothetical protein SWQ30_10020 [Thermodesulfobacteriota bacterium]|nr:hypothetical protein [Thermodesulfobacteriota bacterium]
MATRPAVKDDTFYSFKHGQELLLLTSEEYRRARRRGALREKAQRDALKKGLKWYRGELARQQDEPLGPDPSETVDCIQHVLDGLK